MNMPAAKQPTRSLMASMAEKYNVPEGEMLSTLKATAFRGQVSDAQMTALLIVASQYDLNPWTKEIYAFPDKNNGIVPVVGVDGWSRIINENSKLDGIEFNQSETMTEPQGGKKCPEWIECAIYRKDRSKPIVVREYLDEVYRPPFAGKKDGREYSVNGPWQSHTKRLLRHKALIQCSRLAFGFVGIYDEDEAERIIEKDITSASSVIAPERHALDAYPAERFDEMLPKWRDAVSSGKSPEIIISMISSKHALSEDQKQKIMDITPFDAEGDSHD